MSRKTKNEAQKTRTIILDAATHILLMRGIAQTHLADIAREAKMTRGAIYWHFANKANLLRTLWEDLVDKNDFLFQVADSSECDPLGSLVAQLHIFLRKMPENARRQQLFSLFVEESGRPNHNYSFQFDRKTFQLGRIQKIESLLNDAIDQKQLPSSIDTRLTAIAIISYVDNYIPQCRQLMTELDIRLNMSFMVNGLMHLIRFGCFYHDYSRN